ncbi:heme ABC exporter ATP-binding protein CcmA [Oceanomicrobium pacificus]|uniref:Heme ABC exporter ATP-binding protein CcmA n=1 Tax=Oceanomicrobium pacificus TaxID=2692916 RepID=A0A6B0TX02_9RHOB|nr:heme ABC exporter ATP-binding protein CcmA [Oceanomicrobium pacificus]MXU65553.1 heme ABC exporter ATP-binding protein CcmA [Oceanomicrobium pacificus]
MSLLVSDLGCLRGGRMIFSGLSFEVAAGELTVLRGPNGAGKSTCLRMLAGLIPVTDGTVTLNGASLGADHDAVQEQTSYAGHLDAIKPQMSVAENLRFWARIDADGPQADARLADALDLWHLAPLADRPAFACSAGQKRRLGLARLSLSDRPLWLLDEPTVALDRDAVALFARIVQAHLDAGRMAVIATHIDLGIKAARDVQIRPATAPGAAPDTAANADRDPFGGDWT